MAAAEDPLVHVDEHSDAGLAGHRQQPHPGGQHRLRRDRADIGSHEHLVGLARESGRQQPLSQVRWLIVVVELPFERLAAVAEPGHLAGDHRPGICVGKL
ncbi:MAG: hypothetical protein LBI49_20870 [Nocardiopsaceae bacterium]|nr:hypothetical protein [Nocardiopsaceae bacterium]